MPMRISDPNGYMQYSTVASALSWAADKGARVANISYIVAGSSTVINAANYFRSKGGVVAVSAGNSGTLYNAAPSDSMIVIFRDGFQRPICELVELRFICRYRGARRRYLHDRERRRLPLRIGYFVRQPDRSWRGGADPVAQAGLQAFSSGFCSQVNSCRFGRRGNRPLLWRGKVERRRGGPGRGQFRQWRLVSSHGGNYFPDRRNARRHGFDCR